MNTITRSVSNSSLQLSTQESHCLGVSGPDSVAVAVFVWRSDGVIAQSPSTVLAVVMATDSDDLPHQGCDSRCIYVVLSGKGHNDVTTAAIQSYNCLYFCSCYMLSHSHTHNGSSCLFGFAIQKECSG